MVGPNLPFGGLACGLVFGPLPSIKQNTKWHTRQSILRKRHYFSKENHI